MGTNAFCPIRSNICFSVIRTMMLQVLLENQWENSIDANWMGERGKGNKAEKDDIDKASGVVKYPK